MSRGRSQVPSRVKAQRRTVRLSAFQVRCTAALASMLREHGHAPEFEVVEGEHEVYLRASVAAGGDDIEVYVYDDEAGYFWSGTWSICERPDFDSDDDLESAIVSSIERMIGSDVG